MPKCLVTPLSSGLVQMVQVGGDVTFRFEVKSVMLDPFLNQKSSSLCHACALSAPNPTAIVELGSAAEIWLVVVIFDRELLSISG